VTLSRAQVLALDGIRYAVDMAEIAYGRLINQLDYIASLAPGVLSVAEIATATMDAWTIIDCGNRMHDMVSEFPGLNPDKHGWARKMKKDFDAVCTLRNPWQHPVGGGFICTGNGGTGWLRIGSAWRE
jgi:hypothetical protein